MEKQSTLFRKEVMDKRLNRNLGTFRINVPLNYQITGILTLVLLMIITFFMFC
ncbi:hemolysin D [Legionella moravica]|uniref:Hemolysin D n=1 Tax=Legionella moravica TaxID=39962 RepID=A0A378JX90_9GAMM|nr:hemolysin D [Legionella moravica]STX61639.1 hemolysin D [Legionella moravica]